MPRSSTHERTHGTTMLTAASNVRFVFLQETDYICGEADGLNSRHIQKEVRLEVSLKIATIPFKHACMHITDLFAVL